MKFLYPIKKLNIKPWIKWWILKRLNGGESTLKAVTLSSGTLTKVDKSKALSIKEYYGNTVQNGTPTPESPIPVQTISGNITFNINSVNYSLDLKSKNLFDKNAVTNGYYLNESGGLTANGNYCVSDYIQITEGKTYYIPTRGTSRTKFYTSSKTAYSNTWDVTDGAKSFTVPNGVSYIRISISISGGTAVSLDTFMFNLGETALPYESYYNYELCKIGDYKDKIYNDNGTWKVEKNIGKVVLNGSESWGLFFSTSGVFINSNKITSINSANTINCISNYYANTYSRSYIRNNLGTVNNVCATNNNELILANKSITSVADFKTWLSTNNTTVYYVLSNPTYETITNTNLISQLNALYEFYVNSSTVTISNNSEIPLEVLLKYYMKG